MRTLFIAIIFIANSIINFTASAQIKSAQLTASGLTCSMCSKSIFKSLEQLSFVKSIDVDLEKSIFTLEFKEGQSVSPDAINKAVKDAGFGVASLVLNAKFPETKIEKDVHVNFDGNVYHFLNVPEGTISGDKSFRILDKTFVTNSEFKKNKKFTKMTCYETGISGACCSSSIPAGTRIYHITLQ
jgi:copper chaperone CopZ